MSFEYVPQVGLGCVSEKEISSVWFKGPLGQHRFPWTGTGLFSVLRIPPLPIVI